MKNPAFIFLIFCLLFVFEDDVFSQETKPNPTYYYSDQIDYFPHFQSYKINGQIYRNEDEFSAVLKNLISLCSLQIDEIVLFSGFTIRNAGIYPASLKNSSWMKIELNEKGQVTLLEFYNTSSQDSIQTCVIELLNECRIKPALKDNAPVKCRLNFKFN